MSVIAKHLVGFIAGDPAAMRRVFVELDRHIDHYNATLGTLGTRLQDNPSVAAPQVQIPPLVGFSVNVVNGEQVVTLVNPQDTNPISPQVLIQRGALNAVRSTIFHQVQHALNVNFDNNSGVVDIGINTPALRFNIKDPAPTVFFWRVRSSYDKVNFNAWQVFKK